MPRLPDLLIAEGPVLKGTTPAGQSLLADTETLIDLFNQAGGHELDFAWLVWGYARSEGLSVRVEDPSVEHHLDSKLGIT